jgi:hypothetical protein
MRQGSAFALLCAVAAGVVVACTTPIQPASAPAVASQAAAVEPEVKPHGVYAPYVDRASFTAAYRRLTESQYRHAIADAFGPRVTINARFEPERREDGLQAVGNARLSITTTGLEQYLAVARSVADQVVDGEGRDARVGCVPSAEGAADASCAETFIKWRGQQLFRRPLTAAETASFVSIWESSSRQSGDFHKGLKLSLIGMLVSPDFLFRIEKAEADPVTPAAYRLDAYSTASRLSFVLWDAGPDEELLEAARTGEIQTQAGLRWQIDRLTASPRLEGGVRAFFADMLHFEAFDTLTKDAATYPKFSQAVADSAREETLRFLVDHLVARGGDYRDIFTARDTILNRPLAAVYGVPYLSADAWAPYTFAEDSERSGILTQVTFLSLFSHPGRSSPTIRGVKLHEIFLCVPTPDPPADVDFSKVQATENGTVRTRLIDHMTNPGCSTCHRISDPAGLTLEHFDGLGQRRTSENGVPIDVSAEIGPARFSGAQGLGQYMHDQPLAASCLVRRVNSYGAGKAFDPRDMAWLTAQTQTFAAGGYRMADLYRNMLSDPRFFRVEAPRGASIRVAAAAGSQGEGR